MAGHRPLIIVRHESDQVIERQTDRVMDVEDGAVQERRLTSDITEFQVENGA